MSSDAFSKTLESKPRHSYISHLQQEHNTTASSVGGSTVNRLSRVFEASGHLEHPTYKPKPTPPSKPPSLRPPSVINSTATSEIDQTSLAFHDIRARFQQDTSTYRPPLPLKPSMTGPPSKPEKIIIATKTGPPALPDKPKLNHRYNHRPSVETEPSKARYSFASSSSMLPIPSMITRTATGNGSVMSSTSTSSQTSNSTHSKRGWHISNWFFNQQQQQQQQQQLDHENLKNSIKRSDSVVYSDTPSLDSSVSPQTTGHRTSKRTKVIQELLETEKAYQKDMALVKEIYLEGAYQTGFSKSDIRSLFSNLADIVEFETTFVTVLEQACQLDSVGTCFRETMHSIDSIYSDYCKRHEDAVLKLQELELQPEVQVFLNHCKEQIQGKTTSWDLGSLLIKPVQRVLKYPLLLREILTLTPPTHDDHDDLSAAVKEIQEVADNINEIKRRKDIVEKIVGDKKKTEINVVHGINKRLTRRAQKIKQATGFAAEPTHDLLFEALYEKFEEQQELVRQLARDVQGWVRHVKVGFENLQQLACSMESLYTSWGGVRVKSRQAVQNFSKMAAYLSTNLARELDNDVRGYVYSRIDDFLRVFENPTQVINKRAMKMIDYDRVRDMKLKGDIPDKALQESADAYVSINGQLVDELPKFFALTAQYFDILIGGIALVQLKFNGLMHREWVKLVEQHLGLQAATSYQSMIAAHLDQFEKLEEMTHNITLLNRNRYSMSNSSSSSLLLRTYSLNDSDSMRTSHAMMNEEFECVLLYDFEADEEDQLNVKQGTVLRISQDPDYLDQDWWYGTTLDGQTKSGWVPITYCKKL